MLEDFSQQTSVSEEKPLDKVKPLLYYHEYPSPMGGIRRTDAQP